MKVHVALVAVTCAFIGVLFMALPIAILGSKVTLEYAKLEGKAKVEKEQRRLAIVERKLSMSGKVGSGKNASKIRIEIEEDGLQSGASKISKASEQRESNNDTLHRPSAGKPKGVPCDGA